MLSIVCATKIMIISDKTNFQTKSISLRRFVAGLFAAGVPATLFLFRSRGVFGRGSGNGIWSLRGSFGRSGGIGRSDGYF